MDISGCWEEKREREKGEERVREQEIAKARVSENEK